MKKQIFTVILLLMGGLSTFGQFRLDGGVNSLRLQTGGVDRMYITPGAGPTAGNVGVNTTSPDAKFTINGDMSFKNLTRFTVNGGYSATNRNGASVLIFEAGGVLNGIAGGADGMLLYVLCGYKLPATPTTGALIIKHEESVSETVPANRIMTHTGADFNITNGIGGVMMIYDGGRQRWRVMEVTSGGSSFSGWGLAGNSGTTPATDFIGNTDAQPLVVKTNNLERMRVLSDGTIGIGTLVPDSKLHVQNGTAGAVTAFNNTLLTLENSTNAYLSLLSPVNSQSGILMGNPTNNDAGYLVYEGNTNNMIFGTSGSNKMTLGTTGNLGIGASPSTTAKLFISNGSAGVPVVAAARTVIEDNASHYLALNSPDANETGVIFGKPTLGGASGGVIYTSGSDMNLKTGGNNTRVIVASNGNVGIGATTPTAKLDVDGDIVVRKTTISVAGTQNALNRGGGSSIYFAVFGTVTLNGIAGGQDGMILYLFTGVSATLIINNENVGAIAANRIATNTNGTVTISGRGGATLIYDGTSNLWRVIGIAN